MRDIPYFQTKKAQTMRILIGSDLSRSSDEAILQGSSLARNTDDELALCHVLPEPQLRTLFPQEHEQDLEALLELQPRVADALEMQFERLLGSDAPPVHVFIEQGTDYAELVHRAEKWPADLIVVGDNGRSGLARFFLHDVAAQVVRYAPCAVLIARQRSTGPVLVATDLSDPAQPAIEAGAREAARRGRSLVVVHVSEGFGRRAEPAMALLGANSVIETADIVKERASLARQIIEGMLDRLRVKGDVKIVDGDPTTEILNMVQAQSAELLVVGTRGRSSVSRVMLGSVAASVVQRAPCSVLAVRLATG